MGNHHHSGTATLHWSRQTRSTLRLWDSRTGDRSQCLRSGGPGAHQLGGIGGMEAFFAEVSQRSQSYLPSFSWQLQRSVCLSHDLLWKMFLLSHMWFGYGKCCSAPVDRNHSSSPSPYGTGPGINVNASIKPHCSFDNRFRAPVCKLGELTSCR